MNPVLGAARRAIDPASWVNAYKNISPIDLFNQSQMKKLSDYYNQNGFVNTAKKVFDGYMGGGRMSFGPGRSSSDNSVVARQRKMALGIGAGLAAGNMLFPDSFITNTGNLAAGGAMHGAISSALYARHKGIGIGYGAWAGLNMLKSGNQLGPF